VGKLVSVPYQVPYEAIQSIREDLTDIKQAIDEITYADLFMAITNMRGVQPRNIEEIAARNEEKLTQLGPVIERVNNEKLEVAIERAFGIMQRPAACRRRPMRWQCARPQDRVRLHPDPDAADGRAWARSSARSASSDLRPRCGPMRWTSSTSTKRLTNMLPRRHSAQADPHREGGRGNPRPAGSAAEHGADDCRGSRCEGRGPGCLH
jgi:hypothetical protein